MAIIRAPFIDEQVNNLNDYQKHGMFHEFKCICRATLVAENKGMVCPSCGKVQDWVHDFMADGSLKNSMSEWIKGVKERAAKQREANK